ncbi:MAG: hypothetical protein WCJ61_10835 [Paludibacter sp.]
MEIKNELPETFKDNVNYPIAFLTPANCLFMKSKTKIAPDGTPTYIPNPNADAVYCLVDCMKRYTPIYTENELKKYKR